MPLGLSPGIEGIRTLYINEVITWDSLKSLQKAQEERPRKSEGTLDFSPMEK